MIFGKNEEVEKIKKEIEGLRKELQEEKEKAKKYLKGWQRAKADYINREREIERQRREWVEFSNLSLVLEILFIYENLNKSLEHKNSNEEFIKGIEQIKKQFDDFLKNLGVEKIKTVGEKFNPEFHEVIEKRGEGGEIVEEIQAGYLMHGRVIKPAKVIIK